MTIMNLHLERDLAIIASNTDVLLMKGADHRMGRPACKVFPLPDKCVVLCGRGVVGLMFNVFAWAHSSGLDLDGMSVELKGAVTAIAEHTLGEVRAVGASMPASGLVLLGELLFVGWSQSRESMAGFHVSVSNAGAVEVSEIFGAVIPWVWGDHPQTDGTLASMTELARRQSALAEESCPGKAWRGDLTLATISRESINLTTVREFWKAPAQATASTPAGYSLELA